MPRTGIPRYDGHGNVYCHNCATYLPASAFAWRTAPSLDRPRYSSYCRPCQRMLDRLRWSGERRQRNNASRLIRQKRQQQREQRERREFVAHAITVLRRRGLTMTDISKLAGVSVEAVAAWERNRRQVTPPVAERIAVVLRETAYLPIGDTPAYRRRLPHPDLPRLLDRCRSQVERYPVRSRWRGKDERNVA